MKKRAFTLVELLISITVLSVSLIISSLIFGHAIRQPKQLQGTVQSSNDAVSKMELKINEMKQSDLTDTKLEQTLRFGTLSGTIEGVYLSYDGSKVKKNDVKADDKLITFIGKGYSSPQIPEIKDIYLKNNNKFIYLPMEKKHEKISASCHVDVKNAVIKEFLKKVRMRFLKSTLQSRSGNYFNFPYVDDKGEFLVNGYPDKSGFAYIGNTMDSEDSAILFHADYVLPTYQDNKQAYLDAIDRDYIAEAFTLNTNAYSGEPKNTLESKLQMTDANQRCVHVIGLPYTEDLMGFYDYNLLLAKTNSSASGDKNKYYPIYDVGKAADTKFNDIVVQHADSYSFDWKGYDVTNFINDAISPKRNISVNPGFMNKTELFSEESPGSIDFPDIKKIYGNTVFYNLQKPVAEFSVPKNRSYTLFSKFNLRQFEESKDNAPVSLLSYNLNSDGTLIDSSTGGFSIYVDDLGDFYLNVVTRLSNSTRNLGFNISNTALYSDGDFDFESLGSLKNKNSRDDFNIVAITIKPRTNKIDAKMDLLKKTEISDSGKYKLNTSVQTVFNDSIAIKPDPNIKYFFMNDIDAAGGVALNNSDNHMTVELSDLLLYSENPESKPIGSSNFKNLTMDYLYRKYLTEKERHEGGFDEYFMNKY